MYFYLVQILFLLTIDIKCCNSCLYISSHSHILIFNLIGLIIWLINLFTMVDKHQVDKKGNYYANRFNNIALHAT